MEFCYIRFFSSFSLFRNWWMFSLITFYPIWLNIFWISKRVLHIIFKMSDKVVYYDKEDIEMNSEFDEKINHFSRCSTNYILDTRNQTCIVKYKFHQRIIIIFILFILWFLLILQFQFLSMGTGPVLWSWVSKRVILIIFINFSAPFLLLILRKPLVKVFGLRQLICRDLLMDTIIAKCS